MSEEETHGYVTDIDYTWGFYSDFAPNNLQWIAAAAGYSPRPVQEGFTFVELGCGLGASTAMYGACYPQGRFFGIDFNERHIAAATEFTKSGGLDNVTFLARSLTDMDPNEVPDADMIALHGVYSWVNADVRAGIRRFIDKKLKPGGLLYISYNSMPGQALVEPVRRFLLESSAHISEGTEQRVRTAVAALVALAEKNPRTFGHGDRVTKLVERIRAASVNYLAHEYFNEEWHSFYFTDLARELGELGLSYAGDARSQRNFPELMVKAPISTELSRERNRVKKRMLLDYHIDEGFHRDVFVRAPQTEDTGDYPKGRALRTLRLGMVKPASQWKREARVPVGTLRFQNPIDDRVLNKVEAEFPMFDTLIEDPAIHAGQPPAAARSVHMLMAGTLLRPAQASPHPTSEITPTTRVTVSTFNREILKRHFDGGSLKALAAPIVGTGLHVSTREALILHGWCEKGAEGAVAFGYEELHRRGHRLMVDGKTLQTKAEHFRELESELEKFKSWKLGNFARLGMVSLDG